MIYSGNSGLVENLLCILSALFIFAIIIVLAIIETKKENERRKKIKDYCNMNGLEYSESVTSIPVTAINFSLLKEKGHSNDWIVGMSGKRQEINFYLFEHEYVTGHGKNSTTHYETICVINKPDLDLPQFFVRDENMILDSLGKLFGGQDINFTEDPEFSKMFVLQGIQESSVRYFFSSKVRKAFVNYHVKGYKYEGYKDCFVVSISDKSDLKNRLNLLSKAINILRNIIPNDDNFNV